MSKYIAVIYCKKCMKELARIEAVDPEPKEPKEPDVFVPQMAEMLNEYSIPDMFCQECVNKCGD